MMQPALNIFFYRVVISLAFFAISFSSAAQVNINGIILIAESKVPVPDVSVYINNTKIGSSSNSTGEYFLRGVMPGIYEIIVSHVGYNMVSKKIEVKTGDIRLDFILIPKVKELHSIVVMSKDLRNDWLDIFRRYFLGSSFAADKTKILNEQDVLFENGQTSSVMRAYSEQPLIIENKELGYRIHFDLVEFFYDKQNMITYFKGFSRFEEITDDTGALKKYERSRQRFYYGSSQHFYHALLADDLANQQFEMSITPPEVATDLLQDKSDVDNATSRRNNPDRNQSHIAERDEILLSSGSAAEKFYLYWKGQLRVKYKKDPYGKNRFQAIGYQSGMLSTGVESGIVLLVSPVILSKNGTLENPLSVQYTGYWSFERIATMLPMDYKPKSN